VKQPPYIHAPSQHGGTLPDEIVLTVPPICVGAIVANTLLALKQVWIQGS
jgi:hypothetical protein